MTKRLIIIVSLLCALGAQAQVEKWGMNRPYVDDKLFHMGFQIGAVFSSYRVTCAEDTVTVWSKPGTEPKERIDTLHARVSVPGYGFRVGFITDLRLCKYLNLRFTPGIEFLSTTLHYKSASGLPVQNQSGTYYDDVILMAMPIDLPLYLKFSAERLSNFRPYVIAGGGVSFNVYRPKDKPILLNITDYFCQVGFGCDLYFPWFKLCPEISYRIGFANQLYPFNEREEGSYKSEDRCYSNSILTMTNQAICLTFNFE